MLLENLPRYNRFSDSSVDSESTTGYNTRDRSIRTSSPRLGTNPLQYRPVNPRVESNPDHISPYHLLSDSERAQRIVINVGGTKFETTRGTLASRPYSYLGKIVLEGVVPHVDNSDDAVSEISKVSLNTEYSHVRPCASNIVNNPF